MGRTACTEPQCLYKGALYLTVELYLYSPYGPYGLYRALVPVQGCTLPYSRAIPVLTLWAVRPVQSLSTCTMVTFAFTFTSQPLLVSSFETCYSPVILHFDATRSGLLNANKEINTTEQSDFLEAHQSPIQSVQGLLHWG
jgi:hypothetical protein